jgi:hypothetical protein
MQLVAQIRTFLFENNGNKRMCGNCEVEMKLYRKARRTNNFRRVCLYKMKISYRLSESFNEAVQK